MPDILEKINKKRSLVFRFTLLGIAVSFPIIIITILLFPLFESKLVLALISFLCSIIFARWFASIWLEPIIKIFNALTNRVDSFKDNDYSTSLHIDRSDEFADLFQTHNELGDLLREERQNIFQRELLLDTVIQNSPQVMLLTDDNDRVMYANFAARKFLNRGKRIENLYLNDLLITQPDVLKDIFHKRQNGLFALDTANQDMNSSVNTQNKSQELDTWHYSYTKFELNSRYHNLHLFKHMTREINREEVKVWKKLIRVISHELNNSLAPIRSLAHSGEKLIEKGQTQKISSILRTIAERADYLKDFIDDYATFARLPTPNIKKVSLPEFFKSLQLLESFKLTMELTFDTAVFDPIQIQQVLINILKNAHESGSDSDDIEVILRNINRGLEININDRGSGMSETVLSNALLPFYSTKNTGSGIGLSLCREITEAHQGKITLTNRNAGGLSILIWLPQPNV